MALMKEIELDNGVVLKYHRISSINKITNRFNIIEVNSYINNKQREIEINYNNLGKKIFSGESYTADEMIQYNKGIDVVIETDLIQLPYNADVKIEEAYSYLKTIDKYKDATDC